MFFVTCKVDYLVVSIEVLTVVQKHKYSYHIIIFMIFDIYYLDNNLDLQQNKNLIRINMTYVILDEIKITLEKI